VANEKQFTAELARLHDISAQSRLRAVETQLSLAFTACALAETEILYRRADETDKLLHKLRHYAETIRRHLNDPKHLPRVAVANLRQQLTQLERRTGAIETRLREQ
jgi:hypothetical protein